MKKVLIVIPTELYVMPECYDSLLQQEYDNFNILVHTQAPIMGFKTYDSALNRNALRKMALQSDAEYFMFVDSDTVIPPNTLKKLVSEDKDIIGGWYQIRGDKSRWATADFDYDKNVFTNFEKVREGVIRVSMLGLGCILVKRKVYEDIVFDAGFAEKDIVQLADGRPCHMGISARWSIDAQKKGYKLYADGDIVCRHLDRTVL